MARNDSDTSRHARQNGRTLARGRRWSATGSVLGVVGMTDRSINLGCVVAYVLWAAVVILLSLGLILGNEHVGQIGLATSAAAATATIRSYFVTSNQIVRNSIALRHDGSVRSVR